MNKPSRLSLLGLVVLVLAASAGSQWWAGRQERQLGSAVASLAQPGDIHMLASETCSACWMARAWFTEHKVRFSECTIETDSACKAQFEAHGRPGTPVLLVRGQPQLGFSPGRLHQALQQQRRG